MAGTKAAVIANQVFLAIPWFVTRPKYERSINQLVKRYPLSYAIVGRNDGQEAEDLLNVIKARLLSSSYVICDATGSNANVSLEFGLAEANDIPRALYLCDHGRASKSKKDSAIIADLAGKKRNHYKR